MDQLDALAMRGRMRELRAVGWCTSPEHTWTRTRPSKARIVTCRSIIRPPLHARAVPSRELDGIGPILEFAEH